MNHMNKELSETTTQPLWVYEFSWLFYVMQQIDQITLYIEKHYHNKSDTEILQEVSTLSAIPLDHNFLGDSYDQYCNFVKNYYARCTNVAEIKQLYDDGDCSITDLYQGLHPTFLLKHLQNPKLLPVFEKDPDILFDGPDILFLFHEQSDYRQAFLCSSVIDPGMYEDEQSVYKAERARDSHWCAYSSSVYDKPWCIFLDCSKISSSELPWVIQHEKIHTLLWCDHEFVQEIIAYTVQCYDFAAIYKRLSDQHWLYKKLPWSYTSEQIKYCIAYAQSIYARVWKPWLYMLFFIPIEKRAAVERKLCGTIQGSQAIVRQYEMTSAFSLDEAF